MLDRFAHVSIALDPKPGQKLASLIRLSVKVCIALRLTAITTPSICTT